MDTRSLRCVTPQLGDSNRHRTPTMQGETDAAPSNAGSCRRGTPAMRDPKGQQTLMDAGPQQSGIPWIGDPDGFEASWMQDPRWMLDPTDTGAHRC